MNLDSPPAPDAASGGRVAPDPAIQFDRVVVHRGSRREVVEDFRDRR
jgi:hypothetical protein